MEKIADIKDLPPWFSMSKYDIIKKLSTHQLINEISWRHKFYALQGVGEIKDSLSLFSTIIDNPIDVNRAYLPPKNYHLVNKVSQDDVESLMLALENCGAGKDFLHHHHEFEFMFGSIDAFFTVNLAAKDSEIIKDFTAALESYRAEYRFPQPWGAEKIETTISKIVTYKVLPYFDLQVWSQINNIKISNTVMARVIYPENLNKGESDIRKQTLKYAQKIAYTTFAFSIYSWMKGKEKA